MAVAVAVESAPAVIVRLRPEEREEPWVSHGAGGCVNGRGCGRRERSGRDRAPALPAARRPPYSAARRGQGGRGVAPWPYRPARGDRRRRWREESAGYRRRRRRG